MRRAWAAFVVTVLALTGLGIGGYSVYQAGYRQGLLENATEITVPAWGFSPFGLFFGFLFLLFFFGLITRIFFWRGWRGGHHGYRRWDHDGESPMEKRLSEWHAKAHGSGRTYRSDTSNQA